LPGRNHHAEDFSYTIPVDGSLLAARAWLLSKTAAGWWFRLSGRHPGSHTAASMERSWAPAGTRRIPSKHS